MHAAWYPCDTTGEQSQERTKKERDHYYERRMYDEESNPTTKKVGRYDGTNEGRDISWGDWGLDVHACPSVYTVLAKSETDRNRS